MGPFVKWLETADKVDEGEAVLGNSNSSIASTNKTVH